MRALLASAVLLSLSLAACKSGPTPAGHPGRWSKTTRYMERTYGTDVATAIATGREYFKAHGYTENLKDNAERTGHLLHGFTKDRQSLILRARERRGLVEVKLKAGPAYDEAATAKMMDDYQAMLPDAARPK